MATRILVVDDEPEIRSLLSRALTQMGDYEVEVAEDGQEALRKVEGDSFDLVLTDLKMPKMDGLELIAEVAKRRPEILMVVMTGHGTIESALEAMKRGASDYLAKPLNLNELLFRIQKVLEEKNRFVSLRDYATELERANQELRRIDQMKSEFVSVASHELRTPLSAIKNAVQLVLKRKAGDINETQAKFLSMAERNIDRLTNILNDLLNLSRIESGRIPLKFEELDLKGIVESTVSSFRPQAEGKSIRLAAGVPGDLPTVYGDREKIEQVLVNLIGNALKFTPEGGEIEIGAERVPAQDEEHGGMVAVSVRDTGIGIPQEHLKSIFKKFYQVEGSLQRSVGGTGLGLAITKGLVELHHGSIWAESHPGKGSTFTFTLPISQGERREPQFRSIFDEEFKKAQVNQTPLTLFLVESPEGDEKTPTGLPEIFEERVKKWFCRKSDRMITRRHERWLVALCEAELKGALAIRKRIEEGLKRNGSQGEDRFSKVKIGFATYPEEAASKRDLFRIAKARLRRQGNESEEDSDRR